MPKKKTNVSRKKARKFQIFKIKSGTLSFQSILYFKEEFTSKMQRIQARFFPIPLLSFSHQSPKINKNILENVQDLTAPSFKWQIFGTRTKLSFGLIPMANQTYPQDGLICGVKLCSDDRSQRISRLKIFPDFSKKF